MKTLLFLFSAASLFGSQVIDSPRNVRLDLNGKHLTVNCESEKVVLDWQKFSIAEGERVTFAQPSRHSIALNRVFGSEQSQLHGKLDANGRVILINPQGIFFGETCEVNTAQFIASTLDIGNEILSDAQTWVFKGDSEASLINFGHIEAKEGDLFLFARHIENRGRLAAVNGEVGLGCGQEIWLKFEGPQRIFIKGASLEDSIDQSGAIKAMNIELRSASPYAFAVRHSGKSEASKMHEEGGRIYLISEKGGTHFSGELEAAGGHVEILGESVHLAAAKIDLSDERDGGTLLIGGDQLGANPDVMCSQYTFLGSDVAIEADSLREGNGGRVIIWSDGVTEMYGTVSVQGGPEGGDGGFIEASGLKNIIYKGRTNRLAPKGKAGDLLLDPESDIIINAAGPTSGGSFSAAPITFTPTTTTPVIMVTDLQNELALGNVQILTNGPAVPGGGSGSITVSDPITWSAATTLQFTAGRSIVVNANISNTNAGVLPFNAIDFDANNAMAVLTGNFNGITVNAALSSTIGNISLTGRSGDSANNVGLSITSTGSVTSDSGNIALSGRSFGLNIGTGLLVNAGSIASTSGTISVSGTGSTAGNPGKGVILTGAGSIQNANDNIFVVGIGNGTASNCMGVEILNGFSLQNTNTGVISINGGASTTNINQGYGVHIDSATITAFNRFSIVGTGRGTGTDNIGVLIESSTLASTGNGLIQNAITGTGGGGTSDSPGVSIAASSVTTESAPVVITGTATATTFDNHGISMDNTSLTSNQGGDLTLIGTLSGSGLAGFNSILLDSASSITTNLSGDILLQGLANAAATGPGNVGIMIRGSSVIQSTSNLAGAGTITLEGTGSPSGIGCYGVFLANGQINSVAGDISITGHAESQAGIFLSTTFTLNSTGMAPNAADLTLTGYGKNGKSFSKGIEVNGTVNSVDGDIIMTGTGGDGGLANSGFSTSSANIIATGTGAITITGTGGDGTEANGGLEINTGLIQTFDGDITLIGTGQGTGDTNTGVSVLSTLNALGAGSIFITGTGSPTGVGSNNNGVQLLAPITVTAAGADIDVKGYAMNGDSTGIFFSGPGEINANDILNLESHVPTASLYGFEIYTITIRPGAGMTTMTTEGQVYMDSEAQIICEDGPVTFSCGGDLTIGSDDGRSGIFFGDLTPSLSIGGSLRFEGGAGVGSLAQIGSLTDSTLPITFDLIAGDVIMDVGDFPDSYLVIGHGDLSTPGQTLSGDITLEPLSGSIILRGGSGAGSYGFAQIGHLNSTGSTVSGDITATVDGSITLTGGDTASTAYARIGHGGQANATTYGPSEITLIAGQDIAIVSGVGDAAVVSEDGPVTLVVDNLFPTSPGFGTGKFIFGSTLSSTGEMRIYTAYPDANTINDPINGETFVHQTSDNPQEEYFVYYPGGSYSTADFRIYYKTDSLIPPVPADDIIAAFDQLEIALAQLGDLLPLFGLKRLPIDQPYGARMCQADSRFSLEKCQNREDGPGCCPGLFSPYGGFYMYRNDLYRLWRNR